MQAITKFARKNPLVALHVAGSAFGALCVGHELAFSDYSWLRHQDEKQTFLDKYVFPALHPGVIISTYIVFTTCMVCPPLWIVILTIKNFYNKNLKLEKLHTFRAN